MASGPVSHPARPGGPPRRRHLWAAADWEPADAAAIQALAAGNANEGQQRRALDWIIQKAAMTYDEPFEPQNARVTDYVLGRRSVGLALVKLLNIKLGMLQKESDG